MKCLRLAVLSFFILLIGCSKSKSLATQKWFKGNLHTHSYWSDGDEFPEVIMDWYKANAYHFVALTDHNTLSEGDKWIMVKKDSIYQRAFKKYLDSYGSDWVNYKIDSINQISVKLKTYEEYKERIENDGQFLVIQSEEITDYFENKPLHLNAHNIKEKILPQGGNSVVEVLQNNIDEVTRLKDELDIPMLVHINHPNFYYAIGLEDMIALRNERFFEIYNGHPMVNNMGDSIHISTEEMWDLINIAYLKNNKPLMYGLATDDSHNYHVKGRKWSNAGRGWVMVQADSLNRKPLIESMEAGSFYSSTGVELKELTFYNNNLSVEVKNETGVNYQISFIGCKKGKTAPEQLMLVEGNTANFTLTNEILFVRCKITSTKLHKNPIEDLIYETAWTQPVTAETVINE